MRFLAIGIIPYLRKPRCCRSFPNNSSAGSTAFSGKKRPRFTIVTAGGFCQQPTLINMRLDQITNDVAETLRFPGSPSNANCALRTLRRMLHKAADWKLIIHAPKIKLVKEHGRSTILDEEAERKLIEASVSCGWRRKTLQLFQDILRLMRDTGLRNERELYRMCIENLDWEKKLIFVRNSLK